MADNATPHLAITDADGIHEYVFSPRELWLVRGGSRLQRDVNDEAGRLATTEPIVCGGGRVVAEFPSAAAAETIEVGRSTAEV